MSLWPSGMIGEKTSVPKRTDEITLPPRWAMPWISLFFTSMPAIVAVRASMFAVSRMPCPPTPTRETLTVFITGPFRR